MPAPYSIDLREKAVSAVGKGGKKSHVCRTLNISRNTLDLWIKKKKETGSVAAKRDYERGPRPKIDDLDKFREFAEENGHLTQKQMAEKWPEPVSKIIISKALKKIGFTRKKTYIYREIEEEARKAFEDKIKQYATEKLIYMDQAGLDDTLDYPYEYCHKSERLKASKLGHRTKRFSIISW